MNNELAAYHKLFQLMLLRVLINQRKAYRQNVCIRHVSAAQKLRFAK
jgi:hypothetical protein